MKKNTSYTMYPNLFSFLFLGILIVFFTVSGLYFYSEFPERATALWLFSLMMVFILCWMSVYHIDDKKFVARKLFFPHRVEIPLKSIKKAEVRKYYAYVGAIVAVLYIKAEKEHYFEISLNYGSKSLGKFLNTFKNVLGKRVIFKQSVEN